MRKKLCVFLGWVGGGGGVRDYLHCTRHARHISNFLSNTHMHTNTHTHTHWFTGTIWVWAPPFREVEQSSTESQEWSTGLQIKTQVIFNVHTLVHIHVHVHVSWCIFSRHDQYYYTACGKNPRDSGYERKTWFFLSLSHTHTHSLERNWTQQLFNVTPTAATGLSPPHVRHSGFTTSTPTNGPVSP